MTPELAVALALSVTGCFIALLVYERVRGMRHGRIFRGALDELISKGRLSFSESLPRINRGFLRQLFHYTIHQALSLMLWSVRQVEEGLRTIARLNRRKARVNEVMAQSTTHLQKIAEHKEETALTEREKRVRKDAALRGDSPR